MKSTRKLDKNWFKNHFKDVKSKAGPRYSPKLNVELPISQIFDGICRNSNFYNQIRKKYGELIRVFKYISSQYEKHELQISYDLIKNQFSIFLKGLEDSKEYNSNYINWDEVHNSSEQLSNLLCNFVNQLINEFELSKVQNSTRVAPPSLKYETHHVRKLNKSVDYFVKFSQSIDAKLSNNPILLLKGVAGSGKTHLICDLFETRLKNGAVSVILFGEYFTNQKTFWSQIFDHLYLNKMDKKLFLQKLNKLGEKNKNRSLLIIDALNENNTHSSEFWKQNLDDLINDLKHYPHIGLILTVRNGFENDVFTPGQLAFFNQEEHYGFIQNEWVATSKFFLEFDLPLPEVPILKPEFQNPLFLLLFCTAFSKKRRDLNFKNRDEINKLRSKKTKFRGIEGATYIFEVFALNATKILAKKYNISKGIHKSPDYRIWSEIIKPIAEKMVDLNDDRISESDVINIINEAFPEFDNRRFLQDMENITLIVKIPNYSKRRHSEDFDIRFPFQKFSDHLIGRYIFKKFDEERCGQNKDIIYAKKFFSKRRKIGKFISNTYNLGIIEALSVQCPEQLKGVELIEVAPYLIKNNSYFKKITKEAFLNSIIWRNPKSFNVDTIKFFLNRYFSNSKPDISTVLDVLLSVSTIPDHPFNSLFLHSHLDNLSLPIRDSYWSIFLHDSFQENTAVDRLLTWALADFDKKHCNDHSIVLTSITLSWFLSTSNRFVRDKATKALVNLLQNRIHLICPLLVRFSNVNDYYIKERIYAVAYSCILRNQSDVENIQILCQWIYDNTFKAGHPPTHILLRDYARGSIEAALKLGANLDLDTTLINPPYKSLWPKNIPTVKTLKKIFYPDTISNSNNYLGLVHIWSSVMYDDRQLADFGNYVVNSSLRNWTGKKFNKSEPDRKFMFDNFIAMLNDRQKKIWNECNPLIYDNKDNKKTKIKSLEFVIKFVTARKTENEIKASLRIFKRSLQTELRSHFTKEIYPYLDDNYEIKYNLAEYFDTKVAQRWIVNKVLELGYNPKLHGKFDSNLNEHYNGRSEHKAERIGKKYQWIAYHEFLALVSDHYQFRGKSWNNCINEYTGTWNPHIRDIDPTFLIQNDQHLNHSRNLTNWENKYFRPILSSSELDNELWLNSLSDIPSARSLVEVIDDCGEVWLVLNGSYNWNEKIYPEFEKYDIPHKQLWVGFDCYIINKNNHSIFFNWAKKQKFMGRWMPEINNIYEAFISEFSNTDVLKDLNKSQDWFEPAMDKNFPTPLMITNYSYLNEFTTDCSGDSTILVKLPCNTIIDKMGLIHKYSDGRFYDKLGNLVVTPSNIFNESNYSSLYIKKNIFLDFLKKENYSLVWTCLGRKNVVGGRASDGIFPGSLEINGAYSLSSNNNIIGKRRTEFIK